MDSAIIFVYTTFPDLSTAEIVIKKLISLKLVACANIFPSIQSIYPWAGELQISNEVAVHLKTYDTLFDALTHELTLSHPYESPCIAKIPIGSINAPYKKWLDSLLRSPDKKQPF